LCQKKSLNRDAISLNYFIYGKNAISLN